MSAEEERVLIQRLAAGELDAVEEERALALTAREPALAALLERLQDLQARVRAAFPEPPDLGDGRAFVARLRALTPGDVETRASADLMLSMSLPAVEAAMPEVLSERFRQGPRQRSGKPPLWLGWNAGASLFNLREISREDGLSLELELYAGDLLALHNEVLLVSAFAGSYAPTPGSLFGAIAERYGISFAAGAPPGTTRHPGGLLHFEGVSCAAFGSLWVIEMRERGEPYSLEDLRGALAAIGERLPDMLANASSITLPLLGTGDQQLDPRDVVRELLSSLPRWAQSPRLGTIRVVAHDLSDVALLNRALEDRPFGRTSSALSAACFELSEQLERREWRAPVRAVLKDLLQIASAPEASMRSIALQGRRVAEIALMGAAQQAPSDRAAPHLELLLAYGRSAAADAPIAPNDAVMILYAAIRVAEMTLE